MTKVSGNNFGVPREVTRPPDIDVIIDKDDLMDHLEDEGDPYPPDTETKQEYEPPPRDFTIESSKLVKTLKVLNLFWDRTYEVVKERSKAIDKVSSSASIGDLESARKFMDEVKIIEAKKIKLTDKVEMIKTQMEIIANVLESNGELSESMKLAVSFIEVDLKGLKKLTLVQSKWVHLMNSLLEAKDKVMANEKIVIANEKNLQEKIANEKKILENEKIIIDTRKEIMKNRKLIFINRKEDEKKEK